jgi:hypothetical protein
MTADVKLAGLSGEYTSISYPLLEGSTLIGTGDKFDLNEKDET